MAKYICDFEVVSGVGVDEAVGQIAGNHPSGDFEFYIKNLDVRIEDQPRTLSLQIVLDAKDIDAATESGDDAFYHLLDVISFVTRLPIQLHRHIQTVDWTPGLEMREFLKFNAFSPDDIALALNDELVHCIAQMLKHFKEPTVRRALNWFRRGIIETRPEDQFQFFWFAIEILAERSKATAEVPDLCVRCSSPLFCEKCAEVSTHRPYPKQAIRQLFTKHVTNEPDRLFKILNGARNVLLHGGGSKDVESSTGKTLRFAVNQVSRVAWVGLLAAIDYQELENPVFMDVSDVTHTHATVCLRGSIGCEGDLMNPRIEDVGKVEITVTEAKGPDLAARPRPDPPLSGG